MNDKNHNDLSIPYKVPQFVCLEEGMEQGEERGVALSRENANAVTIFGFQAVTPAEQDKL